ncbi:MAG: carbonic anhydrase [Pseudomonadota bacterium]
MLKAMPLPPSLVQRYRGWKATTHADNAAWYRRLAEEGQRPRAMVISCCDSRVNALAMFGAEQGEFFIHRNIASLIPPFETASGLHGTSAAVEYAVRELHVAQLIVLGHSHCGGVKGCHDMCAGLAPDLERPDSFVGRWMDILRPGYEAVKGIEDEPARLEALEKQAVLTSLENLMTFPFVAEAVEAGQLALHGLWNDIAEGSLEIYDAEKGTFRPV